MSISSAVPPEIVQEYVPPPGLPTAVINNGCPGQATGKDKVITTVTGGHFELPSAEQLPSLPLGPLLGELELLQPARQGISSSCLQPGQDRAAEKADSSNRVPGSDHPAWSSADLRVVGESSCKVDLKQNRDPWRR